MRLGLAIEVPPTPQGNIIFDRFELLGAALE
jgi:hypothetical protein